jgi:uncharacterized repeat protein (TIGR03803 family)
MYDGQVFPNQQEKASLRTFLKCTRVSKRNEAPILTLDNIYGTTWLGGVYSLGTVFRLDSSGKKKTLHSFGGGSDGANPLAAPVLDQAGNMHGTTPSGGAYYFGTLFTIDTGGRESVLYSFTGGTDGAYPYSHLLLDVSGKLYGTASQGGCCGQGTVFEFSNGILTALYGFSAASDGIR